MEGYINEPVFFCGVVFFGGSSKKNKNTRHVFLKISGILRQKKTTCFPSPWATKNKSPTQITQLGWLWKEVAGGQRVGISYLGCPAGT